jgi:hypothetical protein
VVSDTSGHSDAAGIVADLELKVATVVGLTIDEP